ncbi:alpha/beta hydrolase family protein [Anatilimnocola sp. NA78]|uniref:alpha/beta hydrolase family protein n=1 Tax=Anatilimnocola sp. NA78 TaxID=3415683 RepID=UPI003CE4F6B4
MARSRIRIGEDRAGNVGNVAAERLQHSVSNLSLFPFAGTTSMSQGNYDPRFSQQNPFAPNPGNFSGLPGGQFPQQPPKSNGTKNILIAFGIIGGVCAVLFLACCGGLYYAVQGPAASAVAKQPFNVSAVPVPAFPDRGMPTELTPGVQLYSIKINGQTGGHYSPPGHGGTIFVYLPAGQVQPKSLPCVLITGAGTDLMQGVEFDEILGAEDVPEHIPYVKAGMAVVAYEMDGSGYNEDSDEEQMYEDFKASQAGLVNARNALEYILKHVPEVNPAKIYTAGHSSAGTAALLFAAHDPRVAGCVAFAPCSDVENFQPKILIRLIASDRPGLIDFLCQSSPKTHAANIKCPVLLFSAEDDGVVDIKTTRDFERLLKKHNTDVTLQTVPTGDHYQPMIDHGIPAAIEWIKQRAGS